ncbi:hypothetical protein KCMC57_up58540 [Kitasatospora sp. CMC57]|uniref:Uncharacterized protein n=1 Tax=Kitasatospora sp. CMC57 TaxID=3231513 RepID=A0AB33KC72_9ACTN
MISQLAIRGKSSALHTTVLAAPEDGGPAAGQTPGTGRMLEGAVRVSHGDRGRGRVVGTVRPAG